MSNSLSIRWRSFALPKRGNSAEEYEDAFGGDPKTGRFAVADGASESSFAGTWARILTNGFLQGAIDPDPAAWLKPLRRRWAEEVGGLQLPWYAEEKRDHGAFATFLGLEVERSATETLGRWTAYSVGDACLFHLRHDELLAAFPLENADDFGNQPPLLGSRGIAPAAPLQQLEGTCELNDYLLLMTDALAQWFLRRHEKAMRPWVSLVKRLAEPNADAVLTEYVEKLRDKDELRNDDVTLIAVRLQQGKGAGK